MIHLKTQPQKQQKCTGLTIGHIEFSHTRPLHLFITCILSIQMYTLRLPTIQILAKTHVSQPGEHLQTDIRIRAKKEYSTNIFKKLFDSVLGAPNQLKPVAGFQIRIHHMHILI